MKKKMFHFSLSTMCPSCGHHYVTPFQLTNLKHRVMCKNCRRTKMFRDVSVVNLKTQSKKEKGKKEKISFKWAY